MGDPKNVFADLAERWTTGNDVPRDVRTDHAVRFLDLLGWENAKALDMPKPPETCARFVLRAGGQTALDCHFLIPGLLESPERLIEQELDYCPLTRRLTHAAGRLNLRYVFVTDLQNFYLYDGDTDELILSAASPAAFNAEMAKSLTKLNVESGALEEIRRQPRSYVARQLRAWIDRWSETYARELDVSKDDVIELFDCLLVMRYLFEHRVLGRPGDSIRNRFNTLMYSDGLNDTDKTGLLTALLHNLAFHWEGAVFSLNKAGERVLGNEALVASMLAEFAAVSRSKFNIATVLESFNYGDPMEKQRVRMIVESDQEREHYLAQQTLDACRHIRLEVDLRNEGYRAVTHWCDRLVDLYGRFASEFAAERRPAKKRTPDNDLLEWTESNDDGPSTLTERLAYIMKDNLKVAYASRRQYRTARLLLYLHVISRYEMTGEKLDRFPPIEKTFEKTAETARPESPWTQKAAQA